ncbi:hypothetical protein BDP27DRAFT_1416421 [Rhodocollybia butyracea]|uniref:Uncharacterized protein n=1 Tax=Rhodocollybia butyracea TaxID=206335 RepID=A0A9P5Q5S5_9AGAR|nr:hypothetical protein BDP27DRAFT_1416421 [Rhodocollybia butyracea]
MMRYAIFLLHVLFISTLCSSVFGMPLEKRADENAADDGVVRVHFYKEDGSPITAVDPGPRSRKGKKNQEVKDKIEEVLKSLPGITQVTFDNVWERPDLPGDVCKYQRGSAKRYTTDRAFAVVYGLPNCGDDGCFAWFSFPTTRATPTKAHPEIKSRSVYWEVLRPPQLSEDGKYDFTTVARSLGSRYGTAIFEDSRGIFLKDFKLAKDAMEKYREWNVPITETVLVPLVGKNVIAQKNQEKNNNNKRPILPEQEEQEPRPEGSKKQRG